MPKEGRTLIHSIILKKEEKLNFINEMIFRACLGHSLSTLKRFLGLVKDKVFLHKHFSFFISRSPKTYCVFILCMQMCTIYVPLLTILSKLTVLWCLYIIFLYPRKYVFVTYTAIHTQAMCNIFEHVNISHVI